MNCQNPLTITTNRLSIFWLSLPFYLLFYLSSPASLLLLRSAKAINQAQRKGLEISTSKKQNAATNKQHAQAQNALKLDQETDVVKIKTVDISGV